MELSQINVYRIIHIENIKHILNHGITHKNSSNSNPNFKGIGDASLIETRSMKNVNVDNGDISNPIETIILGDFTPFYFGIKMPMLYVIQNGGNFVEQATNPEKIVYIACSVQRIRDSNLTYYFSDGHATDYLTTFYNSERINDLPTIIDWDSVKASYWGGQENLNTKRKKQAEFLVKGDIPAEYIVGYGCFNEFSKQILIDMGIDESMVKVIPNAYY